MGLLDGKVALITGAARGQGRSHAQLLAEEGADIIALDICKQLDTVHYAMSTPEDLEETVRLVEKTGRRIVAKQVDIRDYDALKTAVTEGVSELGRLDIVLANAGIMTQSLEPHTLNREEWRDGIDVMLTGTWNTLQITSPILIDGGRGGAIVITSSVSGLRPMYTDLSGGFDSYCAAKFGVVGLARAYAAGLAEHSIRVNTVHPTGCDTPMVNNDFFPAYMEGNMKTAMAFQNTLPVQMVDPIDISRAILYLVGESGRYVTGIQLPVDAGITYAS
ncbi:mycofactocin-coupled SDR family oxidoreductase [Rhodococcus sp. NPDC059968]|uniref:mycofactocin-coupled SDR family oxidoreductase n=1 Tax=Rhodococcus TaxID=1827 RepID=UPI003671F8DB